MTTQTRRSRLAGGAVATLAVAAAALTAPPALAASAEGEIATTQQCDSFDWQRTDLLGDFAPLIEVNQFDPALGEFLRAEHTYSVSAQQKIEYEIWAGLPGNPYTVTSTPRSTRRCTCLPATSTSRWSSITPRATS